MSASTSITLMSACQSKYTVPHSSQIFVAAQEFNSNTVNHSWYGLGGVLLKSIIIALFLRHSETGENTLHTRMRIYQLQGHGDAPPLLEDLQ